MATKKASYKEPSTYFNSDMRKAAEKWEKENGAGKKAPAKAPAKKPAPVKKK